MQFFVAGVDIEVDAQTCEAAVLKFAQDLIDTGSFMKLRGSL